MAQQKKSVDSDFSRQIRALLNLMQDAGCTENVPPPSLLQEPRFTKGSTNQVCFILPNQDLLPVALDSIATPFVNTKVINLSNGVVFELPKPVDLLDANVLFDEATALQNNTRYEYTTALFLPRCLVDCDAVVDSSELALHCSPFADTVRSIQDSEPPLVSNVALSQAPGFGVENWWNRASLSVSAEIADQAGVWQTFLYRRRCGDTDWQGAVLDTTYASILTDVGYQFESSVAAIFSQNLDDGCYEFRIEAKDATHTPQSCQGMFELAGNGGDVSNEASAQERINIDTTPPSAVELTCGQVQNTMSLNWTISQDGPGGIGLAGYYVLRDGDTLAVVGAQETAYVDKLSSDFEDRTFIYQVQPYDSLKNVQRNGGQSSCPFHALAEIRMTPEPEYTAGLSNEVGWSVVSNVNEYSVFFARSGELESAVSQKTSATSFTFENLSDGFDYYYWVTVVDEHDRVLQSDTVHSVQDARGPAITAFSLQDAIEVRDTKWSNNRNVTLQLEADDFFPGKIGRMEILEDGQVQFILPVEPARTSLDTVIAYPVQGAPCMSVEISTRVSDLAGNVSEPASIRFRVDDQAPEPVSLLQCEQLNGVNGIGLVWQQSLDPGDCSGLAGYRIYRDQELIASVAPNVLTYSDIFSDEMPSGHLGYQVQPFDSVGNVQTDGGFAECDYVGVSQIEISALPEFTSGLSRDVCWQIFGELASVTLHLDADCNSVPDDSATFSRPGSGQLCHTFSNLVDGQSYCYWVSGEDEQGRRLQSETVRSRQDNSPPLIDSFSLPAAEVLNDQLWVYSRDLRLQIEAHDPNGGEIWNYILRENNSEAVLEAFPDSLGNVREFIPHTIRTSGSLSQRVALTIQVRDGAGNESMPSTLELLLQQEAPRIFAFPNPFNPEEKAITIRIADNDENEVKIYDFFGNLVRTIKVKANNRDFIWDGRNGLGQMVANGGYICIGQKTNTQFKIGVMKR